MDKTKDDLLRRPLYVFDLPAQLLDTLTVSDSPGTVNPEEPTATDPPPPSFTPAEAASVDAQACSICDLTFAEVSEQRGHAKSDHHRYNINQKRQGKETVTEAEFEKLAEEQLDESLSGSEAEHSYDDDDDETTKRDSTLAAVLKRQANLAEAERTGGPITSEEDGVGRTRKPRGGGKPPLLWFSSSLFPENTYLGIYRAMFTAEEAQKGTDVVEMVKQKQLAPMPVPKPGPDGTFAPAVSKAPHVFLCMIGGGHFAGMVVSLPPRQTRHAGTGPLSKEATVLAHKTFHRYTTRRKQGGSQSANDNAKGNAHSAGSSIRRYNEQALIDEVRAQLQEWKGLLDTAQLLFIRATGATNRRTLFGPYDGQVMKANDARIRGFPFSTRRATQNELMRSFIELTRLKVREFEADAKPQSETTAKAAEPRPAKPCAPKLSEEEEMELLHTSQLQAFVKRSKLPALLAYLKSNELPADFRFQPSDSQQNRHAPTALHLAAQQNSGPVVAGLLAKAGADPTIGNQQGKTAFEISWDRATRDAFRVARHELGEDRWDWEAAKVPAGMTRQEADEREERERTEADSKEAERRRAEEARLKTEVSKAETRDGPAKGSLVGGLPKTAQERREEENRGLTAEQRMKLERERRARAAEARMVRLQG